MGKPAARLTDSTAHGGLVSGPGVPTVLIGKMPAATLGDLHVCPMLTGPVPHVGGPIILGSTGVLLGKKPAARMGDMAVCVGPPSTIILGCMTVLIGEAGSGSQAGSAAAAAAAGAASKKGPKSIKPFPLWEHQPPRTENHFVECEFTDSAGRPVNGVFYKVIDPEGNAVVGATTAEGRIRHDGYGKAGSFKVELKTIANAKWSQQKANFGEALKISADADGFKEGAPAKILVFEQKGANDERLLKTISAKIEGKKIKSEWTLEKDDLILDPGSKSASVPGYFFLIVAEGLVGVSNIATVADYTEFTFTDEDGKPMANTEYEMVFADGKVLKGKADGDGYAKEEDLPAGTFKLQFPGQGGESGKAGNGGATRKPKTGGGGKPGAEKDAPRSEQAAKAPAQSPSENDKKEDDSEKAASKPKEPKWIAIAKAEIGIKEKNGAAHNPRILEYHATTDKSASNDETPWCSSFVNWVMIKAGYKGTNSAWALNWKNWGKKLEKPAHGCIAVFFNKKKNGGHVGFVVGKQDFVAGKQKEALLILGGNQSDAVNESKWLLDNLVTYVIPSDYEVKDFELPDCSKIEQTSSISESR